MRQDYANARAAFENSLFKLRDYGEGKDKEDEYKEVESNFTVAYLMLARSWQKLGEEEKAANLFARVGQLRPDLKYIADADRSTRSNVLLIVDYGVGPRKMRRHDNSIVTFGPPPSQAGPIPRPRLVVDGEQHRLGNLAVAPIDLLEMAQDRRWQSIDTIRVTKSIVGTGLMGVGAYQGIRHNDAGAAAALIAAGALLKGSATGDVRHWEMLPRTVFLLPLQLSPGRHDITLSFPDRSTQSWRNIVAPGEGEAAYYMRLTPFSSGQYTWPPGGQTASAAPEDGTAAPKSQSPEKNRKSNPDRDLRYSK
jgi:hypothetical protein